MSFGGAFAGGMGGSIVGGAVVQLILDDRQFQQGLASAQGKTKAAATGMGGAMTKAGGLMKAGITAGSVAAIYGMVKFGKVAVAEASAVGEAMSATGKIFGQNGQQVIEWSSTVAESAGLAKSEALNAAVGFGSMFNTIGLAADESARMSMTMTQLAGDMGSFFNQDPSEMLERLRSGLAGEAEPLRRFGVFLSEAAVAQEAVRMGLAKKNEELTEAQKVQARYNLIMQSTNKLQGDFADTVGESLPNQKRQLDALFKNVAADVGKELIPALQDILPALGSFLKGMSSLLGNFTSDLKAVSNELGGGNEVTEAENFEGAVAAATKEFAKGKITVAEYNKRLSDLDALYREASGGATAAGIAQTKLGDAVRQGTISNKKADAAQKAIISSGQKANAVAQVQAKLTQVNTVLQAQAAGKIRLNASELSKAQAAAARYSSQIRILNAGLQQLAGQHISVGIDIIANKIGDFGNKLATGGILAAANGMIARRPTVLVGEGRYPTFAGTGAEAVVPLNSRGIGILAEALRRAGGGNGGPTIIIQNAYGFDDFAQKVDQALMGRALQRVG